VNWETVHLPLSDDTIARLRAGDQLLLTGTVYTARDRAHAMIADLLAKGAPAPVNFSGSVIYFVGPTPPPAGKIIGSAGPTTSSRMDPFTEMMLSLGVKGFIGKGKRSEAVRKLLCRYRAVYFATYGGAGAYLSKRILSSEIVAFPELGPEAMYRYEVKDFPVIVANDIYNGDLHEHAVRK
jgi:fumarate hydratase subunit beta